MIIQSALTGYFALSTLTKHDEVRRRLQEDISESKGWVGGWVGVEKQTEGTTAMTSLRLLATAVCFFCENR